MIQGYGQPTGEPRTVSGLLRFAEHLRGGATEKSVWVITPVFHSSGTLYHSSLTRKQSTMSQFNFVVLLYVIFEVPLARLNLVYKVFFEGPFFSNFLFIPQMRAEPYNLRALKSRPLLVSMTWLFLHQGMWYFVHFFVFVFPQPSCNPCRVTNPVGGFPGAWVLPYSSGCCAAESHLILHEILMEFWWKIRWERQNHASKEGVFFKISCKNKEISLFFCYL